MGLTVHYTLKSSMESYMVRKQVVEKIRQVCMDLPFEKVGEIVDLTGEQCNTEARRDELQNGSEEGESLFWLLIQAGTSVKCPWNKYISWGINPNRILAFDTWPGPGSEAANFGLCRYPDEIEREYSPEDDQRFWSKSKNGYGMEELRFDWEKWKRHCDRNGMRSFRHRDYKEVRKVPTGLKGWHWSSFCKTQYASNPKCGGIPNFLRCHISLVTALNRMAKISGLSMRLDDEGKYGPSTYSDDYQEAYAAGRKPKYTRHKGQYNAKLLAEEVGSWNEMIGGMVGALTEALGAGVSHESEIEKFPNFEQLEFRGQNEKYLAPFLQAMKQLSVKVD